MQSHSTMKVVLAVAVCVVMAATGCTGQWISVALADLPVLTQMALNIATLVAAAQGRELSATDTAAIQNISSAAYGEMNSLQTLYNQYKANPSAGTLQKIQAAIAAIDRDLPAQLQAAHISDPALAAQVTAGVNLMLATVQSFAGLMPGTVSSAVPAVAGRKLSVPKPGELKSRWNREVCAAAGSTVLDTALSHCALK